MRRSQRWTSLKHSVQLNSILKSIGARLPLSTQQLEQQKAMASFAVSRIVGMTRRANMSIEDLFRRIDEDGSGEIDLNKFRRTMLVMEVSFTDEEIQALISQLDADGGGTLTLDEFVPKLMSFQQQRAKDAVAVLSKICQYLNSQREPAAVVFSRLDTDGGGSLDLDEFHSALSSLGIEISREAAVEVMDELDMDGGGDLELKELTAKLDEYRRGRRAFAARVLGNVLEYTKRTNTSVTRVFARVDKDGSGDLDIDELQQAIHNMGQVLSQTEVQEVMIELDIDGSGTISAPEFLDKLKQFGKERAGDISRCKELFAEIDEDASGFLDEKEVKQLVKKMGFQEQMKADRNFVKKLMDTIERSDLDSGSGGDAGDGQISCSELTAWYLDVGKYYLKRPEFKSASVSKPTPAEREALFAEIDVDGSGELDLSEVHSAVAQLWPDMAATHTDRAFATADEDGSGLVGLVEFKKLLGFIVWFNEKRHQIEELEEHFGDTIDADKFYFACSSLGEPMADEAALENYYRLCELTGHRVEEGIQLGDFLGWLARRHYVDDEPTDLEPDEQVELLEDADILNARLAEHAGEFGDVHMQDLASVLKGRKVTTGIMKSGLAKLKRVASRSAECTKLVKDALRFATENNNCFPHFDDDQLRRIAACMRKEDYFAGQNIVTQGEDDKNYYVLRRGKVEVHINGVGVVGHLQWGMGFGEVALVLGTKRTATVRCVTPCEVMKLTRAQYETEVSTMNADTQGGELQPIILKFWDLCTGPDGSCRPEVDFSVYLKLHLRVSKTLMEDEEGFDEDEERDCARVDWAEDMERYGLATTDTQSKGTFVSSMYQLVDLWAEDRQISYATFMAWLFDNIAVWDDRQKGGAGAWVFAKLGKVECIGKKFIDMKAEAVSVHEKFVGENITSAANQAREQFEEELAKQAEEDRLARILEEERVRQEMHEQAEAEKRRKLEEKARKKAEAQAAAEKAKSDKQATKRDRENRQNGAAHGGTGGADGTRGIGTDGTDGLAMQAGSAASGGHSEGLGRVNAAGGGSGADSDSRASSRRAAGIGDAGHGGAENGGAGNGSADGPQKGSREAQSATGQHGVSGRDVGKWNGRGASEDSGSSKHDGTNGQQASTLGSHIGAGAGDNMSFGKRLTGSDGNDRSRGRNAANLNGLELHNRNSRRGSNGDGGQYGGAMAGYNRLGDDRQYEDGTSGQGVGQSRWNNNIRADGGGREGGGSHGMSVAGAGGPYEPRHEHGGGAVRVGEDRTDSAGRKEAMYTAQLGTSELLSNALRPLKPPRSLLEKRAREQREAEHSGAEGLDLFFTGSFKRVQAMTRWPIQPLWPADTNGAMHPIAQPDSAVSRGFRPMTNGRPGSICGVKGLFKDEMLLMDSRHRSGMPANAYALPQHRTLFTTPGGMHVKEVTLNGAESTILSFDAQELQNALCTVGEGQSTSSLPGRGKLEPFVSRGLQVGPSHKCAPRVMRPGTREMNRVRSFSRRLGDGHGRFRNWRVTGAFGPREVEKLAMFNIDRAAPIAEDAVSLVSLTGRPNASSAKHNPAERDEDTKKETETHRRTRSKSIARQGAFHSPDSFAGESMSPLPKRSLSAVDFTTLSVLGEAGAAIERAASTSPTRM